MSRDLTPTTPDFTGGVKSKTHRRQWGVNGFNGFNAFSLEGYTWACARADATYPYDSGVKSVKSWFVATPYCDYRLTPPCKIGPIWCKTGRKVVGWSA